MPTVITGTDGINQVQAGAVKSGDLPAGSVIQVVQDYDANTSDNATTSTSMVPSGIKATITPLRATSVITISFSTTMTDSFGNDDLISVMRVNGGQMPGASTYHAGFNRSISSDGSRYIPFAFSARFFPTDTSALEFEVFYRSNNGNGVRITHPDSSYCLTLMEIAG